VVQEVFKVLLQKLPEFEYDPGKSFRAWLGTVTRNKCVDFLRRQKSLVGLNDKSHAIQLQLPDNAEMIAEAEHRQYLIRRAIELMQSQLPPTMWQAIHRHIVLDQPAPEVAGELGITANAIYVAKSRVLRQIRQELAELLV
jgi:RNA polymerase sigma-70 factor (ECF subfamily)